MQRPLGKSPFVFCCGPFFGLFVSNVLLGTGHTILSWHLRWWSCWYAFVEAFFVLVGTCVGQAVGVLIGAFIVAFVGVDMQFLVGTCIGEAVGLLLLRPFLPLLALWHFCWHLFW